MRYRKLWGIVGICCVGVLVLVGCTQLQESIGSGTGQTAEESDIGMAAVGNQDISVAKSVTTGWSKFLGTWTNVNPATNGCTRFVISGASADALLYQGYGKCHPTDCVWVPSQLVVYASSVSATWIINEGFATRIGTLQFQNKLLQQTIYTKFLDTSGRSNYRSVELFSNAPARFVPLD